MGGSAAARATGGLPDAAKPFRKPDTEAVFAKDPSGFWIAVSRKIDATNDSEKN